MDIGINLFSNYCNFNFVTAKTSGRALQEEDLVSVVAFISTHQQYIYSVAAVVLSVCKLVSIIHTAGNTVKLRIFKRNRV